MYHLVYSYSLLSLCLTEIELTNSFFYVYLLLFAKKGSLLSLNLPGGRAQYLRPHKIELQSYSELEGKRK